MTHAIVAVDVCVFALIDDALHILLIKMTKKEMTGKWAVPGELVAPEESLEDSVEHVLSEKTGLENIFIQQLETFGAPNRDPFGRVISVAYLALVHADQHTLRTTEEYAAVQWHPVGKLPRLAYDHKQIIKVAVDRLQAKLEYTNIARGLLSSAFTLTELQEVYEIILGRTLDKRNFRKKILSLGIVKKTKKVRRGEQSRPAALYSFVHKSEKVTEIL